VSGKEAQETQRGSHNSDHRGPRRGDISGPYVRHRSIIVGESECGEGNPMAAHAFISYSRTDRGYIERLAAHLTAAGLPVWFDFEVETGEPFGERIQRAIDVSSAFVIVLTPAAASSDWVRRELSRAARKRKPLCPLLLAACEVPIELDGLQMETVLSGRMPGERFTARLRELLAADGPAAADPPVDPPEPQRPLAAELVATIGSPQRFRPLVDVSFSPDGRSLAVATGRNTVRILDTTSWRPRRVLRQHWLGHGSIYAVAFDGDRTVVTGGSEMRGVINEVKRQVVQGWDAVGGRKGISVVLGEPGTDTVNQIAVSGDGRLVATTSFGSIAHVWQRYGPNRQVFALAHGGEVRGVAFNPDGSYLATASHDRSARIWDMRTGAQQLLLETDRDVSAVAFSPDGRRLATTTRWAQVWDVETGTELRRFDADRRPGALVLDVAFSTDGRWLLTAGTDNVAQIWDAHRGELLLEVRHHHDDRWIRAVALSPDGRWLATGGDDGVVKIWRITADA
jgi:hypothetical protein